MYDKQEVSIPNLGLVQMHDQETDKLQLVNTSSKKVRNNYANFYREKVAYFETGFSKSGAGSVDCSTEENYVKKLLGYFKRRN